MSTKRNRASYFELNNIRPLLRGKIHEFAFYFTLALLPISLYLLRDWRAHFLPLIVYFASILCQYAVSGYYNQKIWKCPLKERLFQKLDHSCIYLLISGSYTQMCVIVVPYDFHWEFSFQLLFIVWFLAICGVLKTLFLSVMPAIIDTLIYIGLGCACLPYLGWIIQAITIRDLLLMGIGGAFYIIGGLIFALEKPDPFPKTFGSHEIFHVCTVIAQICFFIPALFAFSRELV